MYQILHAGIGHVIYNSCAMTIQPVYERKQGLGSNISVTVRDRRLVTMEHQ